MLGLDISEAVIDAEFCQSVFTIQKAAAAPIRQWVIAW